MAILLLRVPEVADDVGDVLDIARSQKAVGVALLACTRIVATLTR